jgi:predicted ATPase/DNA-binding XRE family transcriptional regulator
MIAAHHRAETMTTVEAQSFGMLVRQHRKARALTQEELAERADLSVRELAYLERDRHAARPGTARRLAEALELSADDETALLAAAASPGAAVEPRRTGTLPVPPTPFIGRAREVAAVLRTLLQPEVRLLTLTGPGGIGKTRLGLQAGSEAAPLYGDGVVFVSLAAVQAAALIPEAIATSLGLEDRRDRSGNWLLAEHLREKDMLLILDNFEHLLEAAPQVGQLIAATARLTVLVTSRARLRLSAEHVLEVPPLSFPDAELRPSLETIARYDAVSLFASKARAHTVGFSLTEENVADVAGICRRLEGVPLAIELAAARLPLFPPQTLLRRLVRTLPLLTAGARDAPDRQQTLRSAIDWSFNLLDEAEQSLLQQLSVFAGGCSLEAAEAVCVLAPAERIEVVDALASLREKSLVQTVESRDGEPYFTMLETIREYARDGLEAGLEAEAVRRRHAEYFTGLAERAVAGMAQARTDESRATLAFRLAEEEADNFHAALTWAAESGETELGLRLVGALSGPWYTLGLQGRFRTALETLLTQRADVPPLVRAKALLTGGWCDVFVDGREVRDELFSRGLAIYREVGDQRALLGALVEVAGSQVYHWGDISRAEVLYEEALPLARELGAGSAVGACLRGLGEIAQSKGDAQGARRLFEESLAVERAAASTGGIAHSLHALAWRALVDGDAARAWELSEQAERTYREVRQLRQVADVCILQGIALLMRGDHAALDSTFHACASEEYFNRFDYVRCNWLALIAASRAVHGDPLRAARVFAAAGAYMPIDNTALRSFTDLIEECLTAGRARVDGREWKAALEAGQSMTLREAVTLALEEAP